MLLYTQDTKEHGLPGNEIILRKGTFIEWKGPNEAVKGLAVQNFRLFVHDPGQFAYLISGGVGGDVFELMKKS